MTGTETTSTSLREALVAAPHTLPAAAVVERLGVDTATGLASAEVQERRTCYGRNELDEVDPRPRWLLYLDQFRNVLVALLVVGAVIAAAIGDLKDSIAIAVVLVFNATLGYLQEQKASRNLAALREMLEFTTTVRRDGELWQVPTTELVPGDIVLVEAGDRVPADGRVVEAWAAQVDESSLTGESVPVEKTVVPVLDLDVPLGDRSNVVLMNTQVTQGRIVVAVTATGMRTEVGKVASLVVDADESATPLQRQLDTLGKRLAAISGVIVVVYFLLGVARGESVSDTLISAVALLVAAIPEGLPAVVTLTLAVGTARLAKRGAIVKRLASVETLGSTSVICSDKTGTLTVNQMTVRSVWLPGERGQVDVESLRPEGGTGDVPTEVVRLAELSVLCNDSDRRDGELIGDPTEGALVVMADELGIDIAARRAATPRVGEVPFDSARKFMVTAHRTGAEAELVVKGAWEVVIARCRHIGSATAPLDAAASSRVEAAAHAMARAGLRVLAVASRPVALATATLDIDGLLDATEGMVLQGLVGLVDPPRAEVPAAIAVARSAGIAVKMVTGDHLDTARAIADQIGLQGDAISGAELEGLDDDELARRIEGIAVVARVSPQHKVRIVEALRTRGEVVAMTGDGVNDAAALSVADIGVAMGNSGTEVAKDAADMVLADDNFATITAAVEQGRTIYNNIVKFVRFQVATNIGALASLIGAQLLALPVPFNPIQLLWINIIMDGPPAMALGVDPDTPGEMDRPPRPGHEQILSGSRLWGISVQGVLMALGTLGVLAWAQHVHDLEHALTLAFTTFVLMQVVNAMNVRDERRSAFRRSMFANRSLNLALVAVIVLQVLAVYLPVGQRIFGTVSLGAVDWLIAVLLAGLIVVSSEITKAVARRGDG